MENDRPVSHVTSRLTVIGGLVLMYVLMLGPVDGLQSAGRLPEPVASGMRWLYAPLSWAIAHAPEPVHKVFFEYVHFWVELLRR